MNRKLWFALLLLMPSFSVFSRDLGNADIIDMIGAKLPEKTIINIIQSSTVNVDTSAEAITKIRSAGASDALVEEIFKAAFKPQTAPISQSIADNKKENFLSESRILLVQKGKNIDLVAENHVTRQGFGFFTPTNYVDFRPLQAAIRLDNPTPIFEQSLAAQSSPQSSIFLVKLEKSIADTRVATLMYDRAGGIMLERNAVIPLEFEQIQDASRAESTRKSWRFKPKRPLEPGEYAFYGKGPRFYTFGLGGASQDEK